MSYWEWAKDCSCSRFRPMGFTRVLPVYCATDVAAVNAWIVAKRAGKIYLAIHGPSGHLIHVHG